jgi:hypothetical protein
MREELERVRAWADSKIATGEEPPWAWYQYMKLRETLDAILSGMAAVTTESLPQSEQNLGVRLRLVDARYQRDIAQPHLAELPPPLPM